MDNKNIFVLPTTEPSCVYLVKNTNALALTTKDPHAMEHYGSGTHNQHVYITNKDPYERGDWVKNVTINLEVPFKLDVDGVLYTTLAPCKFEKIVLTTDLKLVADGIKEIEVEFLRLLKDKKLEEINIVEVEKIPLLSNNGRALYGYNYKPIIRAKENLKKHTVILAGEDAIKEERERGIIITHINKQETLQEVAERILANNIIGLKDALNDDDLFLFYKEVILHYGQAMAEWQKENTKKTVPISDLKDGYQQELFNYLHDELGAIALQSQMHDIENIVVKMRFKDISESETPMKSLLDFVNKIKINLSNKDELITLQFIIDTIKNEYIDKENKLLLQKKYSSQEVEEMLRCYGIDICSKVMGEPMIGNLSPKEWLVNYNLKK